MNGLSALALKRRGRFFYESKGVLAKFKELKNGRETPCN
jgi:hypothetical protein